MKRVCIFVVAVMLCLALVACTQNQVINSVDVALTAASIALPVVAGAAGLPPAVVADLLMWVQMATKGLQAVTVDLQAGGPASVVAANITRDLSGVVASVPNLQGLPVAIASVVQALAGDVSDILSKYGTKVGGVLPTGPNANVHFGAHDQQRLVALQAKAAGILADSQTRMQMLKK